MARNYQALAQAFFDIRNRLARARARADASYRLPYTKSWPEMSADDQKLATSTMEVLYADHVAPGGRGQDLEFDRNRWQRMVGVLMTTVEQWAAKEGSRSAADLISTLYRTVNANHFTGAPEVDPYLDVAKLTVEQTLRSAVAAGLVIPGPNAPTSLGAPHQCAVANTTKEEDEVDPAAPRPAGDDDWTALDGRSNSSPLFTQLVAEVRDNIVNGAFDIVQGHTETVARVIVARLAHRYGLRPKL